MSDALRPLSFTQTLSWMLRELESRDSIFGIPRALFHAPDPDAPYVSAAFGHRLATPVGPAAGPHTQLAQNIVCAWLSGGRYIELKTVQVMDELEIPRPCIDMADEGYNVEWSQELKLRESADEYVKAWVLIHVLRRLLGREDEPFGTVFNMSVGYDLKGIRSAPMVAFMDTMADASAEIAAYQADLAEHFPQFSGLEIPARLTDNVCLSTMHGCPPDEIQRIAEHLLTERGLNTYVKLNPTLLGPDRVHRILHENLGFAEIAVPGATFLHDLPYDRALDLITSLKATAAERDLEFGVKLSNTLPTVNHRAELPGEEMYMSGRTLYPLTVNLFQALSREFDGNLNVSFSGGADALNVADLFRAGAKTVTAATDLLKPGGYSRMLQYMESLGEAMAADGAASLRAFASDRLAVLDRLAAESLAAPRYKKSYQPHPAPKVASRLGWFDCIEAPCMEQCAVRQDVPEYVGRIAAGEYDEALRIILARNPLPGVTGYICTHACQTRCTRSDYDEPVAIRGLKRFAFEHGRVDTWTADTVGKRVAIIGAGPSGLSAAAFLALNGVATKIFEARDRAGGMAAVAPKFRLPDAVVQKDVDRIRALGVEIELNTEVTGPPESLLEQGFDAVYVATGFRKDAGLGIEGLDGEGVHTALEFLKTVNAGEPPELGRAVLVIGGGNTAVDAARTAGRLTGRPATLVYRRTRDEMPADLEEIADLEVEGIRLETLVTPKRVVLEDGRVTGLACTRNELGEPGADGRRRPVEIAGSEFTLPADAVIAAIGQSADLAFLDGSAVKTAHSGKIEIDPETGRALDHVFAGGDAVRGPETIIAACADGRRAAEAICAEFGVTFHADPVETPEPNAEELARIKRARARKSPQHRMEHLPAGKRGGFDLVDATFTETTARKEAERCLQCTTLCEKCVEVCPNRANVVYEVEPREVRLPVLACRDGELVVVREEVVRIEQRRQILHIDDFCNECGNCATFCVHQGRPYMDKPRLFLTEEAFLAAGDNAVFVEGDTVRVLREGRETRVKLGERIVVEDERGRVELSGGIEAAGTQLVKEFEGEMSVGVAHEAAAFHAVARVFF